MTDPEQVDLVNYARKLAVSITRSSEMQRAGMYSSSEPGKVVGAAAIGLELLRRQLGPDSPTVQTLAAGVDSDNRGWVSGAVNVAHALQEWADASDAGVIGHEGYGARAVGAGDLMDQVRQLLEDRSVSPAAPIVLAGAALEIALRGLLETHGIAEPARRGISSYADALRSGDVIDVQTRKEIEVIGGLRNDAAHGHHEDLSRERAGAAEQQVTLLLGRLSTA